MLTKYRVGGESWAEISVVEEEVILSPHYVKGKSWGGAGFYR